MFLFYGAFLILQCAVTLIFDQATSVTTIVCARLNTHTHTHTGSLARSRRREETKTPVLLSSRAVSPTVLQRRFPATPPATLALCNTC